jgi:hypothetical protein
LRPQALSPTDEVGSELVKQEATKQQAVADGSASPDVDTALTGALTLPANPVDGAEDSIQLDALDHVLGKIAKQQAILRGEFDDEPESKTHSQADAVDATDDGLSLSRKGSADSRRSTATEEYDGVILKSPPSNFGAPLGSL